jgi:hypothetical protein
MSRRSVTQSRKDRDGDITALCNPAESWSPRAKADAIQDIEGKLHSYYVLVSGAEVDIVVVKRNGTKYLRTDPDKTKKNNLDDLPDC